MTPKNDSDPGLQRPEVAKDGTERTDNDIPPAGAQPETNPLEIIFGSGECCALWGGQIWNPEDYHPGHRWDEHLRGDILLGFCYGATPTTQILAWDDDGTGAASRLVAWLRERGFTSPLVTTSKSGPPHYHVRLLLSAPIETDLARAIAKHIADQVGGVCTCYPSGAVTQKGRGLVLGAPCCGERGAGPAAQQWVKGGGCRIANPGDLTSAKIGHEILEHWPLFPPDTLLALPRTRADKVSATAGEDDDESPAPEGLVKRALAWAQKKEITDAVTGKPQGKYLRRELAAFCWDLGLNTDQRIEVLRVYDARRVSAGHKPTGEVALAHLAEPPFTLEGQQVTRGWRIETERRNAESSATALADWVPPEQASTGAPAQPGRFLQRDDYTDLAASLKRRKDPEHRAAGVLVARLAIGEPLTDPGTPAEQVETTLATAVGALVAKHPDLDVESVAKQFEFCGTANVATRLQKALTERQVTSDIDTDADTDARPVILIDEGNQAAANKMVMGQLHRATELYSRAQQLVRVVRERDAGRSKKEQERAPYVGCIVRPMPSPVLLHHISELVTFRRRHSVRGQVQQRPAEVPDWCLGYVQNVGEWPGIRPLVGVLETPAMGPSGSIIQTHGYDDETGYYLADYAPEVRVPECPTQEDARRAWGVLTEPFRDFDHIGIVDRVAPVAAILTLLARPAIVGAVPGFVSTGAAYGAGKGLQIAIIGALIFGQIPPIREWPSNEEEQRKVLDGYALAGASFVGFDNIDAPFGGTALAMYLTCQDSTEIRVLGKTGNPRCKWRGVILGSGIGVELPAETARRILRFQVDPNCENPAARPLSTFEQPDIVNWVIAERSRLLSAGLTILRAYHVAGRPRLCGTVGSFEGWSSLVGGAVAFATDGFEFEGQRGPEKGPVDLAPRFTAGTREDPKRNAWLSLFEAWARFDSKCVGKTIRDFWSWKTCSQNGPDADAIDEALATLGVTEPGQLGALFQRANRKVVGPLKLFRQEDYGQGSGRKWCVGQAGGHK